MRYLRFEDEDELIGHLHLMDVKAIAVAVSTPEGEACILFNDTDQMEELLKTVKEAADEFPVDVEVISEETVSPRVSKEEAAVAAVGEEHG